MRSKKIINKKFQLGFIFKLIALNLVSFALLVLAVFVLTGGYDTSGQSERTVELKNAIATQDAIVKSFITYSNRVKNSNLIVVAESVKKDHARSMETMKKNFELLTLNEKRGKQVLLGVIIIMLVNLVMLYAYLIIRTNKIYGPIHVMSKHLDDIRNKKQPEPRKLRAGDDFIEFYGEFTKMIKKIKFPEKKIMSNENNTQSAESMNMAAGDQVLKHKKKMLKIDSREFISNN